MAGDWLEWNWKDSGGVLEVGLINWIHDLLLGERQKTLSTQHFIQHFIKHSSIFFSQKTPTYLTDVWQISLC